MINKFSKGKEHTRRPLPVRALAILLAFAMVLSVLYISNRRNKVEAATSITDSTYFQANILSASSVIDDMNQTYNVYVPTSDTYEVEFAGLPSFDGGSVTVKMLESGGTYSVSDSDSAVDVTVTYTYGWYIGESTVSKVSPTAEGTTLCLKKVYSSYTLSNTTDITSLVESESKLSDKTLLTAKFYTYTPSTPTYSSGSIEDSDYTYRPSNGNDKYYGSVSYYESGVGTTLDDLNTKLNNLGENESISGISKTITVQPGGEGTTIYTLVDSSYGTIYTKNDTLLVKYWSKVGDAARQESAASSSNSVALDKVAPNQTVQFGFSTDVALSAGDGEISVTKSAGAPDATISNPTGNEYIFEISGDNPAANTGTFTYTVSINDSKSFGTTYQQAATINYSVTYDGGIPTIESIKVNDANANEDGNYYVTTDSANISATAVKNTENGAINSTSFTCSDTEVTPSASTDAGTGAITGSISGLKKGSNTFNLSVTSSYGISSASSEVNVFYDPDSPYIINTETTKLAVNQTIGSTATAVNASYDEGAKTYKAEVSGFYATSVTIPVSDTYEATASGIASVTVNGTSQTISGSKVTISSAAASDQNSDSKIDENDDPRLGGQDETYTIVVTDKAGNSQTYTLVLDYLNEIPLVTATFNEDPIDSSNNYFHWKGNNRTATVTYKVYTNVDLEVSDATKKPHIMMTSTATTTETRVELKSIGSRTTSDNANYKYMYVLDYDYPNASMSEYHLKLDVQNVHGYSYSYETEVRSVDISKPGVNAPTSTAWHSSLELSVQIPDGTYSSGVDYVDAEGTTQTKYTSFDADNKFTAVVKESANTAGTNVKFTAYDKAGNVIDTPWTAIYFVDQTPPKTGLQISDVTVADGTVDTTVVDLQTIPTISYAPTDTPSGIVPAKTKAEISDGTTPKTLNEASTSLSDYFTVTDDKIYTITVYVKDQAGNSNTTTKKIKVDSDKPVVKVAVDDPAAPTKGIDPYYKTDVKVKLTITDTNIDESTIQVLDNDDPVTVTWDDSDPTNLIGYYTTSTVGQHTIKITAKDDSGNTPDPEYATTTFTVDKQAPDIKTFLDDEEYSGTTAYKLSSATSKMVVTDDYSRDTADERVTVKLTTPTGEVKTEVKNGAGPFTFAEDGYYELKYEAIDKAGNPASKVIGFTVDGAKPVHNMYVTTSAAKSAKYSNTYSNKVGKFNDYSDQEEYTYGQYFNTDVFIDVAYFDYNIDSVTVYDNDTPINVNWATDGGYGRGTIAISTEGYHEIKMSSVDKSGNTVTDSGYSDTVRFIVDKTSPELTPYLNDYEFSGDNTYVSNSKSQVGIVDANPDDEDITVNVIRFYPAGGSEESTYRGIDSIELSEDGYYTVTYTVVDRAGNIGSTKHGFTVDNVSPVHNMYVTVENPAKFSSYKNNYNNPVGMFKTRPNQENYDYGQYYNYNVNVELNVFDYNLDWVYVTDNGNEISPTWTWNGAYGTATVTLMSEGYHELKMWSKDLSGNETDDTDPAKMIRLYIDKTAPGITTYVNGSLYSEGSGVRYLNTNASVQVSVNDTNKDTSDLVRTSKMTPPGGSASSSTENVGETTENYSTEADYEVQYVATDLAGNKSGTRNVQFRVDKTPPQLSITGDGTSTAKSVPVSFGIKEAFYWDMTSAKYSIYKKKDGTGESLEKTTDFTPRSSNDSQSYTITEDAEYRFEFSAEDKCGNKTETKGTLIKDGTAPIILLSGVSNYDKTDKEVTLNISVDEAFYSTNKVNLSGTRTDIDGKTTNIDFNQFTTNRTKVSQLEQLFKEDGIYDITVTSTDKAGNSSTKTLHFTIDTTDPEIGDLSKYDKVKTNKFEWDVDLDELVKDLTVCDISVYMDGSLYDGTTEIADGSHVLRVEAVDELGHKSYKEVTFVLDTKGPNIIISNVEDGDRLLESTEVTVTVEIDEDLLDTVSLNDKSVTVSENKATFTINSKGKYRINATAHDEAGNTSSTEIEFTFGKQANILLIAIIAGVAIILLIILMLLIKRRRENYY